MSTPSLHIAILDCDTPVPNVLSKLGKYSDIFSKLLQDAVHTTKGLPQGLQLRFSVFDSVMGEYPSEEELRDIDGIIITGSCEILAFPRRLRRFRRAGKIQENENKGICADFFCWNSCFSV